MNGEGWVQAILEAVSNLVTFSVPFTSLFRSSPAKPLSRRETEWLCHDADQMPSHYQAEVQANPHKTPAGKAQASRRGPGRARSATMTRRPGPMPPHRDETGTAP
ncbi:hypothetical protein GIY62_24695 [Burkholderia plantarii]|uniref:hypothetical protein n=1 Tax=Burkholderia plantarii TaxID=41899 RepID=UPI00272A750C|nr:hypothetical protein [Burkholderia plantarii]WLE63487.1 hypothetical protein GIY62_24695 [Burkholderia plantarii]